VNLEADVVLVGGGPAGTCTALALAHASPWAATRTLLLEKARFPRDKPCAGALGARGDALLREVGVRVDVPSAPVHGMSFRAAGGQVTARPGGIGRVVRRIEFDHALARAATARGVRVLDGVAVEDVRDDSGGVVVRTSAGDVRARAVVGCDGVGSIVRRSMGLGQGSLRAQVIEVDTEPTPGDPDRGLLHFDATDRDLPGYAWDFPTIVDGRPLVCRGVYRLRGLPGDARSPDVSDVLERRLRAIGVAPDRLATRRYAERAFDPGAPVARGARMLVGEAAGIDPVTGEGIGQAIEFGLMAGRFLAHLLGSSRSGPLRVDGWGEEVARSRLARDLGIRSRFARLYYGPRRPEVERLFMRSSAGLLVGCRHFGAQPQDWGQVGRIAAGVAARVVATRLAGALAR
jgi:flavin-dependent dehydrogenase